MYIFGHLFNIHNQDSMKRNFVCSLLLLAVCFTANLNASAYFDGVKNPFIGAWALDVQGGGVGWLEVHERQGFLDASLLWIGGSVLPVSHVYLADENTLVVTRTREVTKETSDGGEERKHIHTNTLRIDMVDGLLVGTMSGPNWNGQGEFISSFSGRRMPTMPSAPDLNSVSYGKPIQLFNGKDLTGWKLINPKSPNGFKAMNGELVNDPVQPENGDHIYYGNLRTVDKFEDFNLKLEVNVPKGNNSGIYLRGMYEVQVFDSYGLDTDSHNMGAIYSRITPSVAAEKPGGSWQALDITLCKRHVTVVLNGKTIIDNQPVKGPTGGAISSDVNAAGPIYLQGDHGNVSYRNMVLTPITSS